MKKKIYIFIVIILIIFIFTQIITNNLSKDKTNNEVNKEEIIENYTISTNKEVYSDTKEIRINNSLLLYGDKPIKVGTTELQKRMYKYIFEDFPLIEKEIKDKPMSEIVKYYGENSVRKKELGIKTPADLCLIADQINHLSTEKDKTFKELNITSDKLTMTANNYNMVNIELVYSNQEKLLLKLYLQEGDLEEKILIADNSPVTQLFDKVVLKQSKVYTVSMIDNFINNLKSIHNMKNQSKNDVLKNYEKNQDIYKSIGIYSGEDLFNIMGRLGKISWKTDPEITSYEFDLNSIKKTDKNTVVKLLVNVNNSEQLDFNIYIANDMNSNEKIKFTY